MLRGYTMTNTRKPSFLGSIIDKNRPKTIKRKADKMMTGGVRRNIDNLSYQEKVDCYLVLVHQVKREIERKK